MTSCDTGDITNSYIRDLFHKFAVLVLVNLCTCVFCLCGGFGNIQLCAVKNSILYFPSLVQILGLITFTGVCVGWYEILLLTSISLKFGNLLISINGFCVKICFNSSQCSIIFLFKYMNFFMFGFAGLNLVIITGRLF